MQVLATAEIEDRNTLFTAIAAHLGFGFVLFYGIQKFFEEIEKKLSGDTKLEIAVWLLDLHPADTIKGWSSTLVKMFELVFGEKHLSWKCLWRSLAASFLTPAIIILGFSYRSLSIADCWKLVCFAFVGNALPDYASLFKTRYLLNFTSRRENIWIHLSAILVDVLISGILAALAWLLVITAFADLDPLTYPQRAMSVQGEPFDGIFNSDSRGFNKLMLVVGYLVQTCFISAFVGRIWLFLYVGCGFILSIARRLDIGFTWFNRRFDIENHPLQCIGLVAGTICALGYWALAAIRLLP